MKRAIVKKMIIVLVIALALCSVISGFSCCKLLEREMTEEMTELLRVLDVSIDRESDLNRQLGSCKEALNGKYRITLIAADGTVLADSDTQDMSAMENHRERKEVREALESGSGYEVRTSDTFGMSMVYAAISCKNGDDVLRLAVESSTLSRILLMNIPAFLLSFGIALIVAAFLTGQLTGSITKPLMEIADQMSDFNGENKIFHFQTYAYRELNIIAQTTTDMSKSVSESLQRLEKERQVRQEFFSNASHELKTPLTAVRGYTELLQSGMAETEEMRQEFLARIHREVQGMTDLVNDILKISRLETKEVTPDIDRLRVYTAAEDVVKRLQPAADEQQVVISMDCAPVEATMSRKHLEEILVNLISNAIKYNQPGGSVRLCIRRKGENLIIRVEDTGIGISEEDRERIFERFYRADKGRSKRIGGTGLGLSIVKHITEYYGGTVAVSSTPGKGSCFTVQLPTAGQS